VVQGISARQSKPSATAFGGTGSGWFQLNVVENYGLDKPSEAAERLAQDHVGLIAEAGRNRVYPIPTHRGGIGCSRRQISHARHLQSERTPISKLGVWDQHHRLRSV